MSEFSYYLSENKYNPIRPGSAGFPQPGHDIKLLNPESLEEAEVGEEGMISIPVTDPGLFLEYWNLPEETKKHVHDGWFFTGDYAKYDEDGYICSWDERMTSSRALVIVFPHMKLKESINRILMLPTVQQLEKKLKKINCL